MRWLLPVLLMAFCGSTLLAQREKKEPSAENVRAAIAKAVQLLKSRQDRDGSWEGSLGIPNVLGNNDGGISSLVVLALLEAGENPSEAYMKKSLDYVSKFKSKATYVVSLQTMVLCLADPKQYGPKIKENVDWLMKIAAIDEAKSEVAWGYPMAGGGRAMDRPDHSNTQYAVLALWQAEVAGIPLEQTTWKQIKQFYTRTQNKNNGGWSYPISNPGGERLTMTSAGVCGLLITDMMMSRKDPIQPNADGDFQNCSTRVPNRNLDGGLSYIGNHFSVSTSGGNGFNNVGWYFYNLYGVERVGRLSGLRFFTRGDDKLIDWYKAGARELINTQTQRGGWSNASSLLDGSETIATAFSLLFLAKGRTPVLFHKLAHGKIPREYSADWNLNRNDIRNLTEFCSKNIFKKQNRPVPLTWQIFDIFQQIPAAQFQDVLLQDMMQAPILYITGSQSLRLSEGEKKIIKKYVEQGGFIFIEAACGKPSFDASVREICAELWPDRQLNPLPPGHSIWNAYYPVVPGTFDLHGIDVGCKTCLAYAPKGLSSHWERNDYAATERGKLAFQVGANVVAYATGLEPPEDKLSTKTLVKTEESPLQRNFIEVAQLNYGSKNWQPAPNAMRTLMSAGSKSGLDVILQTKAITIDDSDLYNSKFLYMHGRGGFSWNKEQMKKLQEHLDVGGMLLCDACCADKSFDKSFRATIKDMYNRDLIPIPMDDPLFSARISGQELRQVKGRTIAGKNYEPMDVVLEGIRKDPKDDKSPWVIIYSKIDIGCALDRHASSDCVGYDHDSALRIALQSLLYSLKE